MERASRERSAGRNEHSARTVLLSTVLTFVIVLVTSVASAETITKEYAWTHREVGQPRNVSFDLVVEEEYLQGYRDYPVEERYDYGSMITVNDPFVKVASLELKAISATYGFDPAALALSFVQDLTYMNDSVTTNCADFARFPLESLVDWVGDCEDKALLYATMLIDLGYDAVLFVIYDNDSGHMATGVAGQGFTGRSIMYRGTEYFYAETTTKGAEIGWVPNDIDLEDVEVVERSDPKGPYREPVEESGDVPEFYYFIMGVLLTGAIAMIAAAAASRKRRREERSGDRTEETWRSYERRDRRVDPRLDITDLSHRPQRRRPTHAPERPLPPPPEEWGHGHDRRIGRRQDVDEEDRSGSPYNPYR